MVDSWIAAEAAWFTIVTAVIHGGLMICLNGLLDVIKRYNMFEGSKLPKRQVKSLPSIEPTTKECLKNVIILHCIQLVALPVGYVFLKWAGMRFSGPPPAITEIILEVAAFMVIEDTLFYWIHRLFHSPFLYAHFHKMHHRYYNPSGIATEYFHPVDFLASNTVPLMAGPLIFKSHVFTFWLWLTVRVLEGVDSHCGYDFWFMPFRYFPFRPGGGAHYFHHSNNSGNYGSLFRFWDWACGTDQKYREFLARRSSK